MSHPHDKSPGQGHLSSPDRKDSHLSLCLEEPVDFYSAHSNGFSRYRFDHDALPELDFTEIDLTATLFGKRLSAPLIIGAMTGGTERTREFNRRLAIAAERCQIGFALGSQRKMLKGGADTAIRSSFLVREFAPNLPLLFGNIGAVQLNYGVDQEQIRSLITQTGCDAFNFHLNPLQEAIQPEGDRNFRNLLPKLREVIPELGVPVLVKEVGAGLSLTTARKLRELPLAGVETAGSGGTSWSKIESLRAQGTPQARVGARFARWGVSTAESLIHCKAELPHLTLIASGGIRNGIEIAKALALGANAVACAMPFLKAAQTSVDCVVEAVEELKLELRTALFVTGFPSVEALRTGGRERLRNQPDPCALEMSP